MSTKLDIAKFKLFPHVKTMGDKKNVPAQKGIYAWYLDFSQFKNISTKKEFEQKIEIINTLISNDQLKGKVKSNFRKYDVHLDETRLFMEQFKIGDSGKTSSLKNKINDLTVADCKKILELFSKFSLLVSPLYVGISIDFQTRWDQHKKAFFKVKKMKDDKEDDSNIQQVAMKSFGGRAAYQGFQWDQLIFACVDADIDRKLIEETEFLINRFYNPIFGKR